MGGEINVLALVRGEEQYIFVFDPSRRTELLRLLGRYAADPELSFNWFDAAVLSQKIRELMPASVLAQGGAHPLPSGELLADSPLGESTAKRKVPRVHRAPRFQIPDA